MSAVVASRPVSVAAIIAVGSELLRHDRTDTNSLYITARLEELGVGVVWKAIVGDNRADLTDAVRFARSRADVIVLTGGLGPTDDDLTRDGVAVALGRAMSHDESTIDAIQARFAHRKMVMPTINRRQGLVIDGARLLQNANGTAPGQWIDDEHRIVLLLPGPPREMRPMMDALVSGSLAQRVGRERLFRRSVRIAGRSESHAEELLQPLYADWARAPTPVAATILAAFGLLELQLTVRAPEAAEATVALDDAAHAVVAAFGLDAFSTDGATLDVVVGRLLTERGLRVAFAESCTGGLVSARLSDVAGCSAYFERSVVAYSNAAKRELLGVPGELIDEHGAVSEPVAVAMAEGIRARSGVDVGVSVTGIAGPSGGSDAKPVGTVVIAVSGPGPDTRVRTALFPGNRGHVRTLAAQTTLDHLRRALIG
jgi:nicotinamide-nucleotide amidase